MRNIKRNEFFRESLAARDCVNNFFWQTSRPDIWCKSLLFRRSSLIRIVWLLALRRVRRVGWKRLPRRELQLFRPRFRRYWTAICVICSVSTRKPCSSDSPAATHDLDEYLLQTIHSNWECFPCALSEFGRIKMEDPSKKNNQRRDFHLRCRKVARLLRNFADDVTSWAETRMCLRTREISIINSIFFIAAEDLQHKSRFDLQSSACIPVEARKRCLWLT